MKTLDKFILKSFFGPMIASFLIIMFVLMMNVLWRYVDDLVGKGLPISAIVELLFYMTSTMLPIGLPLVILFGSLRTMGDLGNSNELLAMRAAGISLFRIMRSVIIGAAVMSVVGFFIVNSYVPYSVKKTGSILYDIKKQRKEIKFKDGVFFNGIPNISIRVGKQNPKTNLITDVLIYDTRDRVMTKTIIADSGYINLIENNRYMQIILFNGQNYEDRRDFKWFSETTLNHHVFEKQEILMALDGFSFEKSDNDSFGNISESKNIKELAHDIDSLQKKVEIAVEKAEDKVFKAHLFALDTMFLSRYRTDSSYMDTRAFKMTHKSMDTMSIERKENIINAAVSKLEQMKYSSLQGHNEVKASSITLHRSKVDWHKKLTLPISIMIFFLIGAPLGAIIRKGGLGMPTVISVLFFVMYYIISMTGEKMVKDGSWSPFIGMWLPTIVLFIIAIFLMWKAITDSKLLDIDAYSIALTKWWKRSKEKYSFLIKVENLFIRFVEWIKKLKIFKRRKLKKNKI